jgi:chaperonin GroEL
MKSKTILYNERARKILERGMYLLNESVSSTLGPKGRNVVLEKKGSIPQIVNDGITIAKEIRIRNKIQNTGVALIRQAASKTNEIAGDGTTTATTLASEIIKHGMRNVAAGANPIMLKRGMDKAAQFVVRQVTELSKPVEDIDQIKKIATISSGNRKFASLIAEALLSVGREGLISLEESKLTSTELEITEGMSFNRGFISGYFIDNQEKMETVLENPIVLLTGKKIKLVKQDLLPILELVSATRSPLLIISDNIEKDALATLIVNKLRGTLNVVAVKAPGFGDRRDIILDDLALITDGTVITEHSGLNFKNMDLTTLGKAKKIIIRKESTTIISDLNKKKVFERCEQLKRQLSKTDSNYEQEKIQERLAKLSGGIAVIKVGAATETEMKDHKLRLEDAINAARAAVEEGVLPGGGSMLTHTSVKLLEWAKRNLHNDELLGALIVEKALTAPIRRIAKNAGKNGSIIVSKIKNSPFGTGYNASNNTFQDLWEYGVIDPAKVVRSSLQNAVSIASMVLTTECIIVDKSK